MKLHRYLLLSACILGGAQLGAAENAGIDSSTLDAALISVNDGTDTTLNFNLFVLFQDNQPRAVNATPTFQYANQPITVNGGFGGGQIHKINGLSTNRGLFIGGKNPTGGSVTINELQFLNCKAKGGNGGNEGGGGGLGAGGGLFVGENTTVTIKDCQFFSCSAQGGSGQAFIPSDLIEGGGGGMRGNGGDGITDSLVLAGGGGGGFGNNGGDSQESSGTAIGAGGGGARGFADGDANFIVAGTNFDNGGSSGADGNGGNGTSIDGVAGGYGGGGGGGGSKGGTGGFGGGGGGDGASGLAVGDGGFGGGGGATFATATGKGKGGFGGGGGAANITNAANSGFGAGNGSGLFGGKGAGFGGAIFIAKGANLTIQDSVIFSNSSTSPGASGNSNTSAAEGFGALGQEIFMMSESTLTFNLTSDVIMPHAIEGNISNQRPDADSNPNTGGLIKQGSNSLLSLTGNNTYSGKTTVEEGELQINGTVITPIVVELSGILSGNFTALTSPIADSGNLTNSGLVKPGLNDVGTINLEGAYEQTGSGNLEADITPDGTIHDKVIGAISAELGGTLTLVVGPGNYIEGTEYVIIDAPIITSDFSNAVKTGEAADSVELGREGKVTIIVLSSRLFEDQKIDSGPPSDVTKCIKSVDIVPDSDFALVVQALGTLSSGAVNKALTSLSAVRFGALEWINARNNSYVAEILSQHLFELCCSPRDCCSCDCNASVWAAGFGNIMDNKKKLDYLRRYNADAAGGIVGMDYCCTPCFYFGGALGYTHTYLHWRNNGGRDNINSFYGALYGSWHCDCMSVDFSALGGGSENDLNRKITFANVARTARSDFWNYFVTGHLGFQYNWSCGCSTFEPFALADYHYFNHENFKEKGADSLNLRVKSKDQHMLRGEAGLKWYYEIDCDCYCFAPYFGASWVGEFPLHKSKQPASFVGQSCVIDATSYDSNVQLGSPEAGIKWTHCNGGSFLLGYKGLFNKKTHINQIEGRFEWIF